MLSRALDRQGLTDCWRFSWHCPDVTLYRFADVVQKVCSKDAITYNIYWQYSSRALYNRFSLFFFALLYRLRFSSVVNASQTPYILPKCRKYVLQASYGIYSFHFLTTTPPLSRLLHSMSSPLADTQPPTPPDHTLVHVPLSHNPHTPDPNQTSISDSCYIPKTPHLAHNTLPRY